MTGKKGFAEWYKANADKKLKPETVIKKLNECYGNQLNIDELEREIQIVQQEGMAKNRAKAIANDYAERSDKDMNYVVKGGRVKIEKESENGYHISYNFTKNGVKNALVKVHVPLQAMEWAVYCVIYDAYVAA